MAAIVSTTGEGNQVVGSLFIVYGTVKAISPDGTERILAPNSPIFANDHITTGSDGGISIMLDGPPPTQLDLGSMTDIVIDEDVYAGVAPEVVTETTANYEQIQEALLAGDQPIDLDGTAAGSGAGVGEGNETITDYSKTEGDKVDISHILDSAEGDHSRLGVVDNGGAAKLVLYDGIDHTPAHEISSVTFENILFGDLTSGDELNSLLGQVGLDHTA